MFQTSDFISSIQNPRIRFLKRLDKAAERRESGLFLIEGLREVVLAFRAGYRIEQLYFCSELLKDDPQYPLKELAALSAVKLTEGVYRSVAYRDSSEGLMAVAQIRHAGLIDLNLKRQALILLVEAVEKPGNLGAMLRTADAAGVDAVIVCDGKTDIYNSNVIRSSLGTVFTNQVVVCSSGEAIRFLNERSVSIYAASLGASRPYYDLDLKGSCAFVVGTEATGLSREWYEAASEKVIIPMLGKIDSLNVSVSAAVLLYEAVRQRQQI